jgi:hypothetical protein
MVLQLAYFDRGRDPWSWIWARSWTWKTRLVEGLRAGPAGSSPGTMRTWRRRSSPVQLISFARRLDPGLTGEDFAYAGLELDQMDDRAFAEIGLSQHQVIALRERFAAWPRHARTASQELQPGNPAQHRPGHEQPPAAGRPESGTHDPHPPGGRQHQRGQEPAAQAAWDDPEAEP